jgi:chemotaxis signal transduction protein
LKRVRAKLEAAESLSEDEVQRVLNLRARQYSEDASSARDVATMDLVAFELADLRLAIALDQGAAAVSISGLIKLPGVPSFYLGLLGHRGRVYPVVDVRPLVGARRSETTDLRYAVLCHGEQAAIGFAATSISGITKVPVSQVVAAADSREKTISAVATDSRIVIDVVQVLENARLLVDEQPALAARDEGKIP